MNLCVFQGTFNPIHNVHLAMANYVKTHYSYNTILFIPAYKPPHKDFDDEMSNHRFQMVKTAISGENFYGISNIEFQNERFSYTYLTIQELYKRFKIDDKIGFIIGSDAFREIDTWYEADKLKDLVHFIVFPREKELDNDRLSLLKFKGFSFNVTNMPPIDVSSTYVRTRIETGKPIFKFVPSVVSEYISKNGLYQPK